MSELVTGIVLAILAGTLIPWVTSLASADLQARRDHKARVRQLFEDAVRAQARRPDIENFGVNDTDDRRIRAEVAHDEELRVIREVLFASFALWDRKVEITTRNWGTRASTPDDREIMRLWANGNRWTARCKARRVMRRPPGSAPTQPSRSG